MFRTTFLETLQQFTNDVALKYALWEDVEHRYAEAHRRYHNLDHLEVLLAALEVVKEKIFDWNALVLAIAYHDIVYDVRLSDNEAQSAEHAAKQLGDLVPAEVLEQCQHLILATKSHAERANSDINYFTDADLSILGSAPDAYRRYTIAIRSEYSIYPDELYKPGRRKVLDHFLAMKKLYKTEEFSRKFESTARQNLMAELITLNT